MTIEFYYNHSEKNKVGKDLEWRFDLNGTLREESAILNPTIAFNINPNELGDINYIHIPEFNRYYFITEIISLRYGLTRISARVDVLETYANEIRQQRAVVQRQQNDWNLYIDDGKFKVYQNPAFITKAFPKTFTENWSYVLMTVGSGIADGGNPNDSTNTPIPSQMEENT